jgi:hypothetical protein
LSNLACRKITQHNRFGRGVRRRDKHHVGNGDALVERQFRIDGNAWDRRVQLWSAV